ncbi:hypothetical protein GMOD_00001602 [Pyrenophora seminiperda CCB06]|uniref:Uncharacterized protein n=1 Tax=Pyrenophora seminiperda CCB06 TaxID=1302712 RepID=A0A3M7LZH1_9PLEO|nr:hypothetical protein GMOD_00001602 [Pyrenophora seminiperda CCB06]
MTPLRELGDTKYSALGIIDPVRSEETTKGRHKDTPTIIFDRGCQVTDLMRMRNKPHVVHEKLDTTACDGNTAFQCIHWFPLSTKVICNGGQQAVCGNDRLLAHVVQQKATSTQKTGRPDIRRSEHLPVSRILNLITVNPEEIQELVIVLNGVPASYISECCCLKVEDMTPTDSQTWFLMH